MDHYPAISSRDRRFDGRFWFGVTTTGIFCRPSCPARTPKPANVRYFASAAAAAKAGFRACRRCRPAAIPGSAQWDFRADVTARAFRLIADGVVDRDGVPGLADRVGYTERHLHRLLVDEFGVGPLALARMQRAQTARTLIESTSLGLTEIAFAAGFGSVRQFNDTIREVYGCAPSELRRDPGGNDGTIELELPFRPPLHDASLFEFLGARSVSGVESGDSEHYERSLRLPHGRASVTLRAGTSTIHAALRLADLRDLAPAVARIRRLLDLDADPVAVDTALAADPALAPLVHAEPGVRLPRAVDGFEAAVRAIVGQQVSVAGARTVLGRLVADGLFPSPAEVLALPDDAFSMPTKRRETLRTLAEAVLGGMALDPGADRTATREALLSLPGIGPWTADYVALRALGDPDIFLPTDLGTLRAAAKLGLPDTPKGIAAYAERFSPWRSYAQIRLWRLA
ncbi:AraC family transcriptional regulator of adaptative response / DNA-3-methyladenine glycosylase II [Allocatelliglobosispora scoriae]|uniref:DNA-3-methyladenine glycosylase II n=1 Tax=Allocatelliglobosispora scoriae TaxID=643052 RepID=A0A841BVZ1_9ACTN|nr:AlkA N-terminal domain-containing protein [Allocatelliglobosispora scoriae]MBB5871656.1 AraC family transcriptional regulator of adaptative response / DNA-3-methyladenine glycosylase II [Allocatelliglobosispora scoriae]